MMWAYAILLLLGVVVFVLGSGLWQPLRERDKPPTSPKERFLQTIAENLGIEPDRLDDSADLLSGPWADELDLTELFREVEEEFDIELSEAETKSVDTVGGLWALVERKITARGSATEHRGDL
jgi:acyl carrier protein